jgi:alpha-amylase
MAIGIIPWTRSFTYDAQGKMVIGPDGPVFAAHPQPLYPLLKSMAKALAATRIKLAQLPPVTNGQGEGYSSFCLRNFNSNWGTEDELVDTCLSCEADGVQADPDIAVRQMTGANGSDVWDYTYTDYAGSTAGGWFAFYGQPGEARPPMVEQDDVPDPSGNFAFGTVRANQHSNPAGAVIADTKGALQALAALIKLKNPRFDDGKGMWAPATLEYLKTLLPAKCVVEYYSGSNSELYWFVHTLMGGICQVENYPGYWPLQRMANGYDCTQFAPGYESWDSNNSVGFANNPDVATSWNWYDGGTISQQIAFNLLSVYAVAMNLPNQRFMIYAEDYFPASANYPTGRGYKPYLDNLAWFSDTFAFGAFAVRWQDRDVLAFTRDGDGGDVGWSGGCLVALNLNTYVQRTITMQSTWPEGQWIHDYSAAGGCTQRDFTVEPGGMLTITLLANAYSSGTAFALLAPGGVS